MPSFASKAVRRRDRIYTPTPVYLAALTGTCVRTVTSTRMRAPAPARAACTAAHGAVCSAASCANLQWRREAGPRPPRCSGCSGDPGAQRVVRPGSRIRAPRLGPLPTLPPAATSRALFSTTAGSEFGAPPHPPERTQEILPSPPESPKSRPGPAAALTLAKDSHVNMRNC